MRLLTDALNAIEDEKVKHLVLAAAAVMHVKGLGIESANRGYPEGWVPSTYRQFRVPMINNQIYRIREEAFGSGPSDSDDESHDVLTADKFLNFIGKLQSEKDKFGNCQEKSALAIHYILSLQLRNSPRIEWIWSKDPDHIVAVIGRQEGSDINNPAAWGEGAVVADPWDETFYPAAQLFQRFEKCQYLHRMSDEAPIKLIEFCKIPQPCQIDRSSAVPSYIELSNESVRQLAQVTPAKSFSAKTHGIEKLVHYIILKAAELNEAENSIIRRGLFSQGFNQRLNETHRLKLSAAYSLSKILAGDTAATFTAEELKALRETHLFRGDSCLRTIAAELLPGVNLDAMTPHSSPLQSVQMESRAEMAIGAGA